MEMKLKKIKPVYAVAAVLIIAALVAGGVTYIQSQERPQGNGITITETATT